VSKPQTFATHRRLEPIQHFRVTPVLLKPRIPPVRHSWKYPHPHSTLGGVTAFALLLAALQTRMYALKVQDRVIRLEESLRMQRLLPADLVGRIGELGPKQFVGLRFAADAELADRVREALDQNLDGEAIKKRIQSWRADTFRV